MPDPVLAAQSTFDRSDARAPKAARAWWSENTGLLLVLLAFSALVVPTLRDGIGNLDSHTIVRSARLLADEHIVLPARQPGHPTTSFYVFGAASLVLRHGFGVGFTDEVYCVLQWLIALLVAAAFHLWLRRAGVARWRAAVAAGCLVFSTEFLLQTLDGEEFLAGILFLLGALLLLGGWRAGPPSRGRLACSIACFALATGCRVELLFAGLALYPLSFALWRIRRWQTWLLTALGVSGGLALVWLPLLLREGFNNPSPEMTYAQALLAWGYKLLFACFGFPTSLILLGTLGATVVRVFLGLRREGKIPNYTTAASALIAALLLGLYILHPHKPAIMLSALPFLLTLVAQSRATLIAVAVLVLAGFFVRVDIFRERVLTAPYFTPGGWHRATESKPRNQLAYIRVLAGTPVDRKSAIIGDIFSWVYDFHLERGTWRAQRVRLEPHRITGMVADNPAAIVLPREAAMVPATLRRWHEAGYAIVMDRLLWRTLYARYDVQSHVGDVAMVESTPVRLVDVVIP